MNTINFPTCHLLYHAVNFEYRHLLITRNIDAAHIPFSLTYMTTI